MQLELYHHLLPVYATYAVAVASPGPSTLAIMGTAMARGRGAALALALGVVTGSLVWAALAAAGLSALLARFAGALTAVKIAGGLYLLWIAWKTARSALSADAAGGTGASPASRLAQYRRGLLLHLGNPKSVLGWVAIMSLGLRPGAPEGTLAMMLAGCAALGLAIFGGYALLFSLPVLGRAYRRARRGIEGALALLFGAAGLRLLLARS
ncbi:LysE family translocator [Poseidonocella sp. HB161398]|uniref:LysE family translocator n=1 Tax=Poseidonocella sp. HB161398 TaxID=2320855 RepID=UPI00110815E1|nr:LysE family translocator [Poseidonocella sp. HB161398]